MLLALARCVKSLNCRCTNVVEAIHFMYNMMRRQIMNAMGSVDTVHQWNYAKFTVELLLKYQATCHQMENSVEH